MSTDQSVALISCGVRLALNIQQLLVVEVLDGTQEILQVDERHLALSFSVTASLAPNVCKEQLFALLEASVHEAKTQEHLGHRGAADSNICLDGLTNCTVRQLELAASGSEVLLKTIVHELV